MINEELKEAVKEVARAYDEFDAMLKDEGVSEMARRHGLMIFAHEMAHRWSGSKADDCFIAMLPYLFIHRR